MTSNLRRKLSPYARGGSWGWGKGVKGWGMEWSEVAAGNRGRLGQWGTTATMVRSMKDEKWGVVKKKGRVENSFVKLFFID